MAKVVTKPTRRILLSTSITVSISGFIKLTFKEVDVLREFKGVGINEKGNMIHSDEGFSFKVGQKI